mgnify:CR=1 FL=1
MYVCVLDFLFFKEDSFCWVYYFGKRWLWRLRYCNSHIYRLSWLNKQSLYICAFRIVNLERHVRVWLTRQRSLYLPLSGLYFMTVLGAVMGVSISSLQSQSTAIQSTQVSDIVVPSTECQSCLVQTQNTLLKFTLCAKQRLWERMTR